MAPENSLMLANSDPLGTPRGRYDEHSSKFSLSKKPMFNRTRRRRESLLKVLLADLATAPEEVDCVSNNVEPAHNTTKILCPNDSVRVTISPVC